jgi:hypothetical protein
MAGCLATFPEGSARARVFFEGFEVFFLAAMVASFLLV